MKAVALLALAVAFGPAPVLAQSLSGPAVAVDGDTLEMTGYRIRLFGIDAPESAQVCHRDGEAWGCGAEARAVLDQLIAGKTIVCEARDTNEYGHLVSVCRAGRLDLSAALAEAGLAVALPQYSDAYVAMAERARANRLGVWSSEFAEPAAWRAANPRPASERAARDAEPRAQAVRAVSAVRSAPSGVYFRNCSEARAAGAAPLYRGQPGYRPGMDGDGDGIACEPYRGR